MEKWKNTYVVVFRSNVPAALQGWSLIFFGPFVDYLVGGSWLLDYRMSTGASIALLVSCSVAIGVNVSQFACLGRFQAVSFQVKHTCPVSKSPKAILIACPLLL